MGRLDGKAALITAAAQGRLGRKQGSGGATAWAFCSAGARAMLSDIDDGNGIATSAEIKAAGFDAEYVHLDVTSRDDWAAGVKATVERFGRLDVLANIRVNAVFPGYADTPGTGYVFDDPVKRAIRVARVPMGDLLYADDVAPAFMYLASDEAAWVTGSEGSICLRVVTRMTTPHLIWLPTARGRMCDTG